MSDILYYFKQDFPVTFEYEDLSVTVRKSPDGECPCHEGVALNEFMLTSDDAPLESEICAVLSGVKYRGFTKAVIYRRDIKTVKIKGEETSYMGIAVHREA